MEEKIENKMYVMNSFELLGRLVILPVIMVGIIDLNLNKFVEVLCMLILFVWLFIPLYKKLKSL